MIQTTFRVAAVAAFCVWSSSVNAAPFSWALDSNGIPLSRQGITTSAPAGTSWKTIGLPSGVTKLIGIAVGHNAQVWALSSNTGIGGNTIYFREGCSAANPEGTSWSLIDGELVQISVGRNGQLWGVNNVGALFFRDGSGGTTPSKGAGWSSITPPIGATVRQVVAAPNGMIWILSSEAVYGGYKIYCRTGVTDANPKGTDWQWIEGGLTMIAAGGSIVAGSGAGSFWGVNSYGNIYCRTGITAAAPMGTGWQQTDGNATKIYIGNNGTNVWIINSVNNYFYRTGITASIPGGSSWVGLSN